MPPVRVKVYGLFGMTRRTYLVCQALTLVVGLAALAFAMSWRPVAVSLPTDRQRFFLTLFQLFPWLVLLILLLGALETWLVLRQFARKQAEADRASSPPLAAPGAAAEAPPAHLPPNLP